MMGLEDSKYQVYVDEAEIEKRKNLRDQHNTLTVSIGNRSGITSSTGSDANQREEKV